MKKRLLILCLTFSQLLLGQTYFTRTGNTDFKASVEAFEPVEATNNSTTAILKAKSGDLAAQLFINAFKFKVALMQEHFNENYMDSNQFPKAVFRGKIINFDLDSLKEDTTYQMTGTLTVRNIPKEIRTEVTVHRNGDTLSLQSEFKVKPQDFGIKIPSIVRKKIADQIIISIHYELVPKK